MRIIRDYQFVDPSDRGATAVIGNFDGVHLGHQYVIDIARQKAAELGAPLGVMTFEPHPREYFAPKAPPFRLMNADTRAHRLEKLGIEALFELSFNDTLSALTPEEFARFTELNDAYKAKFGFPVIMAVKGSNRHQILAAFEERIHNSPEQEFARALAEINKIALFRLQAM